MPVGFYELLQVAPDAPPERVRAAWQDQVAQVVRKMRNADAKRIDRTPIEARRIALNEAYAVLSDPTRRRRYDRFREVSRLGMPSDADELWRVAGPSLVDPGAAAAVEVIRALSDLKVGGPLVEVPARDPVSQPSSAGSPAIAAAIGGTSGTVVVSIEESTSSVSARPATAPSMPPPSNQPGRTGETTGTGRVKPQKVPTPRTGPVIDRSASTEALARLFDQYGPTGAFLKATRDVRKLTQADLSTLTKISQRFLDAMERDAYTELPGGTFVRGYLKMVIRGLEALDGSEVEEFIEGYMSRFTRARG